VVRELALLEPAYRLAVAIFRDSMRAFADGDYELARTLKLKDRELDALTRDLSEKLVARPRWTRSLCLATWTLSSLLVPLSGLGIMRSISRRIPSGATKPLTFVTLTEQRKKINRYLYNRASDRFEIFCG
jgi:hypothetical protein